MPDMVDRPDIVRDNPSVPHNHSTYILKETRLTTELFGLVKPHMIFDDVSTDDLDYRPEYRTRSYTLRAPLMQDVHRKLSYVKVDLSAILPFNYEKFYTNPVIGDDVPSDSGTVVLGGYDLIAKAVNNVMSTAFTNIAGANNFTPANLTALLKSLIFGELFYSRGSLLSSLGSHISKQFRSIITQHSGNFVGFDELFDLTIAKILSVLSGSAVATISVTIDGDPKEVLVGSWTSIGFPTISLREFLNEIRETSDWSITAFATSAGSSVTIASPILWDVTFYVSAPSTIPFNFGRVCAYQLAISEYMTNDKVDHIYSAELFRQYIGSLRRSWMQVVFPTSEPYGHFTANGIDYQYDYLSGYYLYDFLYFTGTNIANFTIDCFQYFITLFGYRRSLRYKDYFVSSRVRPLAVGNVDVAVNANLVSVIDITRNIQVQRFLNAVNHTGRRLSNYIKTFFGIDIKPDRHVPHWLADIDEMVYTSEVENTGTAQQTNPNSVTAVFTGNSGNKQLRFYADLPGYIIGLTSYDIERSYPDTIDRSFFIKDRFDMFIPEMQFIGDQPVYVHELDSASPSAFGTPFGYQYRDMQYKLFYSVADGGFVDNLPGYGFLYKSALWQTPNISPDFIRAKSSELDEFYLSLTGYSLASYFHFISVIVNNFTARRPMIANPKILE